LPRSDEHSSGIKDVVVFVVDDDIGRRQNEINPIYKIFLTGIFCHLFCKLLWQYIFNWTEYLKLRTALESILGVADLELFFSTAIVIKISVE